MTAPLRSFMQSIGRRVDCPPVEELKQQTLCSSGKTDHPDRAAAQRQLISLKKQGGARNMHCYQCAECSRWHIGHQPQSNSKRDRVKRGAKPKKVS